MDKLQLAGWNLGRVFNSSWYQPKHPNLKLKTRPKQLLGSLPIPLALPGYSFWFWVREGRYSTKLCRNLFCRNKSFVELTTLEMGVLLWSKYPVMRGKVTSLKLKTRTQHFSLPYICHRIPCCHEWCCKVRLVILMDKNPSIKGFICWGNANWLYLSL